jgi:hypothetical protein
MSQTRDTEASDWYSWTSHMGSVFTHQQEFVRYLLVAPRQATNAPVDGTALKTRIKSLLDP